MNADEIAERVNLLPRVHLCFLPTPLEPAPRLARALGGPPIFIKRDDLTGLALGGNKSRKLEFNLGDAVAKGATVVVTGAGAQSNHCRQAAAAARRLGMKAALVLRKREGVRPEGNLLLDYLLGADVRLQELSYLDRRAMNDAMMRLAREYEERGERPYVIDHEAPEDLSDAARGALGYVLAAAEMYDQAARLGVSFGAVYVSSQGGTQAGLAAANKALGNPWKVVGVSSSPQPAEIVERIAAIATRALQMLEIPLTITPRELVNYYDERFAGAAYGALTEGSKEALRLMAREEGILLDPVYSSKALAALISDIREGRLDDSTPVAFVHTGGQPTLFVYGQSLLEGARD